MRAEGVRELFVDDGLPGRDEDTKRSLEPGDTERARLD